MRPKAGVSPPTKGLDRTLTPKGTTLNTNGSGMPAPSTSSPEPSLREVLAGLAALTPTGVYAEHEQRLEGLDREAALSAGLDEEAADRIAAEMTAHRRASMAEFAERALELIEAGR